MRWLHLIVVGLLLAATLIFQSIGSSMITVNFYSHCGAWEFLLRCHPTIRAKARG